jgi:hypothetical protein
MCQQIIGILAPQLDSFLIIYSQKNSFELFYQLDSFLIIYSQKNSFEIVKIFGSLERIVVFT